MGNFQPSSPQAIAQQQQQLAQLSQQPANNLEAQLKTVAQGFMTQEQLLNQSYGVIDSLVPFMQANVILNQEVEQLSQMVESLAPFVQMAQIWAQDAIAHEMVLEQVCSLMADPEYLMYWAFHVWNSYVQPNSEAAIDLISQQYLELVDNYERQFQTAYGYMPSNQLSVPVNPLPSPGRAVIAGGPELSQMPSMPMPPIPGNSMAVADPLFALKSRIAQMKMGSPDLATHWQQQHVQNRQMAGVY